VGATARGAGPASTASWCAGRTVARAAWWESPGDITETRQRERQLDTAKAEAAAAHRDVEATREIMQTVLDNMTDGCHVVRKDCAGASQPRAQADLGYTAREPPPGTRVEER
jgi:hypothetical protein